MDRNTEDRRREKRVRLFAAAALLVILAGAFGGRKILHQEKYLFIGDSYAARLESAGYSQGNVLIYAIPGITAKELDDKREEFPDMEPDKVVLMVGINSLAQMEEGEIQIEDEKKLIQDIREIYHAPLYVQKVFPVGEPLLQHKPVLTVKNVAEYNRLLEEYCAETEDVIFFDPQDGFLDENGYLTKTEDNLHIADSYLDQYYENIREALR